MPSYTCGPDALSRDAPLLRWLALGIGLLIAMPACSSNSLTYYDASGDDAYLGPPDPHCGPIPDGTYCDCNSSGPPILGTGPGVCSPQSVGGGACCGEDGWPTSGYCDCGRPMCGRSGAYCICSRGLTGSETDACYPRSGDSCCNTVSGRYAGIDCRCGPSSCGAHQVSVTSCRPSMVTGCGTGTPVSQCSAP